VSTTSSFLVEGANSYFDALGAIKDYERTVCKVCRSVYEKHKLDLVKKIGLRDAPCEDHDSNRNPEKGFVEIGVRQDSVSGRDALYVYLKWDGSKSAAPEISAEVCLEFTTKSDRNDYARWLHNIPSIQRGDDSDYPSLYSSQKLNDLSSCTEVLDGLLSEWLLCWPAGRKLK
jgi:hypothetical protein